MEWSYLVPLSALQHWSYCRRQWALIHQEQVFLENVHTMRGRAVHARVDVLGSEVRRGTRQAHALPLYCDRLGLIGVADCVEFLADGTPYPVEYKHGARRQHGHDDIQLAAQAICLEEMTGRIVPIGAVYHATSRHRREVTISPDLRCRVESAANAIREALESSLVPAAVNDQRCRDCSLIDTCQPEAVVRAERLAELRRALFEVD